MPPTDAVSAAVCAVVTAETVAVNPVVADPAGTVTDPGTLTALLLLPRPTVSPPVPAAALRVTVHASVAEPVTELLAQLNPLKTLCTPAAARPVPLRLTVAVLGEALSLILMAPVAVPVTGGSKATVRVAV